MRIVREVLAQASTKYGRRDGYGLLRLAVLAWVNITPKQLSQLDPAKAFHDVPDATREEIAAGVITLTKPPRHKGRAKVIPAPETIPLTPYGVEAMRAFAAVPEAWFKFSVPPLNRQFKRAAARAQVALAAQGVIVDLSGMTLYHLKHSLASAMMQATNGLFDRQGQLIINPAVVRALDHRSARTTKIYTASAVAPILLEANEAMTAWLDRHLAEPLTPPTPLKIVRRS
jgi:integrase